MVARRTIPGTIVCSFHSDVGTQYIEEWMEQRGLDAVCVSTFNNKYAVEVPPGEEDKYVEILSECDLVKHVYSNYIRGSKFVPREKKTKKTKAPRK